MQIWHTVQLSGTKRVSQALCAEITLFTAETSLKARVVSLNIVFICLWLEIKWLIVIPSMIILHLRVRESEEE